METIAQEAKRLLEPIPEEQWLTGKYTDEKSCCCVLGHLARLTSRKPSDFKYTNCTVLSNYDFERFAGDFLRDVKKDPVIARNYGFGLARVNDGHSQSYQQPTPKQRVLALLNDMIDAGY